MQKVTFMIPYYEPAWGYGGPPRLISNLAKNLSNKYSVTVLTTDALDAKNRVDRLHEINHNLEIIRCPNISNWLAWHTTIIIPRHFSQQAAEVISKSDVVFLSDFRHWLNAVALKWLNYYHKPYILAAFGQLRKPHNWKYPLKVFFDILYGRKLLKSAHTLIAQTTNESKDYIELGAKREQIKLVPLGENSPTKEEMLQTGLFRSKYNIPNITKIILFVGRIHKLKGLQILIPAFADCIQKNPFLDLRLVIIGRDNGYQKEMNKLVQRFQLANNVVQTGPLYGLGNAAAYLDADIFAFTPIHYEETSLAALRSLSFSTPVVTTTTAEIPFLDEYSAGLTIQCSVKEVSLALTRMLTNDNMLNKMSNNAKLLFLNKFAFYIIEKQYEDVVARAITNV